MRHVEEWSSIDFVDTGDTRLNHLIHDMTTPDLSRRAGIKDVLNMIEAIYHKPRILKAVRHAS